MTVYELSNEGAISVYQSDSGQHVDCAHGAGSLSVLYTPGFWEFFVKWGLQDGSETGEIANAGGVDLEGCHRVYIDGLPQWDAGFGFDEPRTVRIYGRINGSVVLWASSPYSIGSSLAMMMSMNVGDTSGGGGNSPPGPNPPPPLPPIPPEPPCECENVEGPNPEEAVGSPEDLDDDSELLLMDPQFTSTTDFSQIRNRVFVYGAGSTLVEGAEVGDTTLNVSDLRQFSPGGGELLVGGFYRIGYGSLEAFGGPGLMNLQSPLTEAFDQGDPVVNFVEENDLDSQAEIGEVELDKDGLPTDGIHEGVIIDDTLKTVAELRQRAFRELAMFSRPTVEISYATRDPNTRVGAVVHVDLTNPPCFGDFLIQDVQIDQIHDEADMLSPRYTVRASSLKFDLNDLLVQIGEGSGGITTGIGGIIEAADESLSSATGNNAIPRNRQVFWSQWNANNFGSAATPSIESVGWTLGHINMGDSGVTDNEGYFWRKTVTAGSNTRWQAHNGSAHTFFEHNPVMIWRMRFGPKTTFLRTWFVLADAVLGNGATQTARKYFGLRFCSADGDTYFRPIWCNGVTETVPNPPSTFLVQPKPNTIFTITMTVQQAKKVVFSITTGTSTKTYTMSVPGTPFQSVGLFSQFYIVNTHGTETRILDLERIYGERS